MYPPPPDLWSGGFFVHAPAGTRRRILLRRRVSPADICMGEYLMSCCQCQNCCCRRCCCGNSSTAGNGGISTLPSFPELPVFPGGGSAVNTRWPVYVSYPAFLWDTAEDGDGSGSCGCCRN